MIFRISHNIAEYFVKRDIIEKDDIDSYAFGFEIIISEIIGWGLIAIIMCLTSSYIQTIVFCSTFVLLRIHAGGYHTNSHLSCNLLFCLVYTVFLIVCKHMPINIVPLFVIIICIINIIIICRFSPIQHDNNRHSSKRLAFHRQHSIINSIVFFVLAIILLGTPCILISLYMAFGMLCVDCSMLFAKLLNT